MMNEERNRKRLRDYASSTSSDEDGSLECSLKKVKISKQFPGQLRLQQDINDCTDRAVDIGLQKCKIDKKNPLQVTIHLRTSVLLITVGRFYPHHAPQVDLLPNGERIRLPILENWLPVHTLLDVLYQLVHNDPTAMQVDH